jgi:hypothetical protein
VCKLQPNYYRSGKVISQKKSSEDALANYFIVNDVNKVSQVKKIKQATDVNRLPKAIIRLKDDQEIKKSSKMDEGFLKETLFAFFEMNPECFIEEIQKMVDQPRGYLTRVLDEICDKKKISNRYVYSLKNIYKNI